MNTWIAGFSVAVAFLVAWLLTRLLLTGRWIVVLDHPNERSLHDRPTPRTGGLAICAGLAAGHLVALATIPFGEHAPVIGLAALLVMGISLADDFRHVPAAVRFLVHIVAACLLVYAGPGASRFELPGLPFTVPLVAAQVLSVVTVVWLVNLYNFMDGMDGFAGGMGVIGFATLALLAWRSGEPALGLSGAVVAGACAGFLLLNFPPARIFMGDAGSSVLGLLVAGLTLQSERSGAFPLWLAVLVFSPFVVDATVTLLCRARNREAIWRAHRSHFYQRLVQLGWGHRRTTLWEYALMLACAVSAVTLQPAPPAAQAAGLCAWVVIYAMLMVFVDRRELARKRDESRSRD